MDLMSADYEQLDCSIPLPEKINGHSFQSTDTLQSLVQSCSCCNRSHDPSRGSDIQQCKLHQPQQRNLRDNSLVNYHKNSIGVSTLILVSFTHYYC